MNKEKKITTIVVEDQIVSWDYINSVLKEHAEVKSFCKNSFEAEAAFLKFKPDLIWLDCYLGEISLDNQGLKNSGLELATWIKAHKKETKIILFTASYEKSIILAAKKLGIEAVILGAKFSISKEEASYIVNQVIKGSTNIVINSNDQNTERLKNIGKMTINEFVVVSSLILGKSTAQIAEELSSTRKQVNNALYRVKEKYELDDSLSRQELLEEIKNIVIGLNSVDPKIPELYSIIKLNEEILDPVISKIQTGELKKIKLKDIIETNA
ncbi:MAG: response regulator [Candidatus Caenarcaniphilales bacterium]|nr:response regulator [Candidatus Caenarcaniphilales bacterium]